MPMTTAPHIQIKMIVTIFLFFSTRACLGNFSLLRKETAPQKQESGPFPAPDDGAADSARINKLRLSLHTPEGCATVRAHGRESFLPRVVQADVRTDRHVDAAIVQLRHLALCCAVVEVRGGVPSASACAASDNSGRAVLCQRDSALLLSYSSLACLGKTPAGFVSHGLDWTGIIELASHRFSCFCF